MTRRTKILATLGPATDSIEKIQAIIAAGANTVRMNFLTAKQKTTSNVRSALEKLLRI